MIGLEELLQVMVERGSSDLHIASASPPRVRVDGELVATEFDPLTKDETQKLIYSVLSEDQIARFEKDFELDFSFGVEDLGRFRTNVFYQRGAVGAVFRLVPNVVRSFKDLGLPVRLCASICDVPKGLVLVTGATGSGKSTTLACMINDINKKRRCHILTIEDPIEYLYRDQKAFVNQREIGIDVETWTEALTYVVRQDPDVILIGELRDLNGVDTALMASETGHLVFGTIHASSAAGTISRLLDFFPQARHHHIRQLLHFNLRAVIVQQLLRGAQPNLPLVPAVELMIVNPGIRKMIRENEDHEIPAVIRNSKTEGMQDMNQALADLIQRGLTSEAEGLSRSPNPEALKMILKGIHLS